MCNLSHVPTTPSSTFPLAGMWDTASLFLVFGEFQNGCQCGILRFLLSDGTDSSGYLWT
jgi:hypothetical protein